VHDPGQESAFVQKPFTAEALLEKVHAVLSARLPA